MKQKATQGSVQRAVRQRNPKIVAVDLFCGVGGLTNGLAKAGIDVRLGVDIDPACGYPYTANNDAEFLQKSVVDLTADEIAFGAKGLRLLAGCAPCQPFSTYHQKADSSDGRWNLLNHFARLAEETKPDLITMENVPNLAKQRVFRQFVKRLKSEGFEVSYEIVDCSAFGVPQSRQRLVLLASKLGPIKLEKKKRRKPRTVHQAIHGLPVLKAGQVNKNDPLHQASELSPLNLKRIKASKPGGSWRDWDDRLVAPCHKKKTGKTYPGVYGRMEWHEPAPTITTQFFGFGNGRFGHPTQSRAISIREGAILQSFPKHYKFVKSGEPIHRKTIGRLVGNAVPVKLAEAIGKTLIAHSAEYQNDGAGMNAADFQNKFLKIGYTKRVGGVTKTPRRRPFIGAKGIGKLALLSCAERITIFSKKKGEGYVGGAIDNSDLDKAITRDVTPDQYPLEIPDLKLLGSLSKGHESGTIIFFEETKEQIKSSVAHIRKMIALYFRFALLDNDFSIYVNGEKVDLDDLSDLLNSTEFVWVINKYEDEFVNALSQLKSGQIKLTTELAVRGFIATVERPRDLKIRGTEERATVDLFVNGRLREKNILRHIPSQRIIESYLYGQIHFDRMDKKGSDPFTSSREGIVDGDRNFSKLLKYLKEDALPEIFDKWDELRLKRGEEGDEENLRKSKKQRKARDLYSIARDEYSPDSSSSRKDVVDGWLDELRDDAEFNIGSYVDCFLSENLARRYIAERRLSLTPRTKSTAQKWREAELKRKTEANLSYPIRKNDEDIDYLGMDDLAFTVEGKTGGAAEKSVTRDAIEYAPVRNVVGHTGLLTDNGKSLLNLKHENIKARIKTLVSEKPLAKKKGVAKKEARRK